VRKILFRSIGAFAALVLTMSAANAASVSFDLTSSSDDASHITGDFNFDIIQSGTTYATVTIDDEGVAGQINFTVTLAPYWSGKEDTSFGIQHFGFNLTEPEEDVGLVTTDIIGLAANWTADVDYTPPNNQGTAQNGFGKFDAVVGTNSQASRQDPLTFSIDNQANAFDAIADYISGSNPGLNGSFLFAVHIAGFLDQNPAAPGGTCPEPPVATNQDCNLLTSVWVGTPTVVPVPTAVWLFGSALGLLGWIRRKTGSL